MLSGPRIGLTPYRQGPADVPLLSLILETSHRLLKLPSSSPSGSSTDVERDSGGQSGDLRVGFVGSVTSMSSATPFSGTD